MHPSAHSTAIYKNRCQLNNRWAGIPGQTWGAQQLQSQGVGGWPLSDDLPSVLEDNGMWTSWVSRVTWLELFPTPSFPTVYLCYVSSITIWCQFPLLLSIRSLYISAHPFSSFLCFTGRPWRYCRFSSNTTRISQKRVVQMFWFPSACKSLCWHSTVVKCTTILS